MSKIISALLAHVKTKKVNIPDAKKHRLSHKFFIINSDIEEAINCGEFKCKSILFKKEYDLLEDCLSELVKNGYNVSWKENAFNDYYLYVDWTEVPIRRVGTR